MTMMTDDTVTSWLNSCSVSWSAQECGRFLYRGENPGRKKKKRSVQRPQAWYTFERVHHVY
jgi:hypothetical protein